MFMNEEGRALYIVLLIGVGCDEVMTVAMIDDRISIVLAAIYMLEDCISIINRPYLHIFYLHNLSVLLDSYHLFM